MDSTPASSYFNLFISGQLESASFPLGPDASDIFARYEIITGPDWERVSGLKYGITQSSNNGNEIVFNMPIEITYQSTSPHGWPQILICIYGKTRLGIETSLGYSRIHIPVFGSQSRKRVIAPILIPKCKHLLTDMANWISGRNPELKDPKILLDNNKSKDLSMEAYGEVKLLINIITKGTNRLGFDWSE